MRNIVKNIIGKHRARYFKNLLLSLKNFFIDYILFYKHSAVFHSDDSVDKLECRAILNYHSIEKGLLFSKIKPRFAKLKVCELHYILDLNVIKDNELSSQMIVAYSVMCKYYETHKDINENIDDYYTFEQYNKYKNVLGENYDPSFNPVVKFDNRDFYQNVNADFFSFSNSRKSVRSFTGELVPKEKVKMAVKLAINTPSVCNRQASKVYYIDDKDKIDKLLYIQGGMNGYTENINQLLILTVSRNYFYSVGERNQCYIDGGLFLMNLLYSLHFYKIANCPANWGKISKDDKAVMDIIEMTESEKIVCFIAIGKASDEFKVTLSKRRTVEEVLICQ